MLAGDADRPRPGPDIAVYVDVRAAGAHRELQPSITFDSRPAGRVLAVLGRHLDLAEPVGIGP
jgi:hypothetical protein